jgi:hypothetical protein
MVEAIFVPEVISAGTDRRFHLPKAYSDKIPWMSGSASLSAWLLIRVPGRFRLLSDFEVEGDPKLRDLRSRIIEGPHGNEVSPSEFDSNDRAALIGRLVATTLTAPPPGWRFILPKHLTPEGACRSVVVLFSSGYCEIWFPEVYKAALESPIESII